MYISFQNPFKTVYLENFISTVYNMISFLAMFTLFEFPYPYSYNQLIIAIWNTFSILYKKSH